MSLLDEIKQKSKANFRPADRADIEQLRSLGAPEEALRFFQVRREDLAKLAKPIAPSFENFLQAFVSETLDIEPLYPPFNSGKPGDIGHA